MYLKIRFSFIQSKLINIYIIFKKKSYLAYIFSFLVIFIQSNKLQKKQYSIIFNLDDI